MQYGSRAVFWNVPEAAKQAEEAAEPGAGAAIGVPLHLQQQAGPGAEVAAGGGAGGAATTGGDMVPEQASPRQDSRAGAGLQGDAAPFGERAG